MISFTDEQFDHLAQKRREDVAQALAIRAVETNPQALDTHDIQVLAARIAKELDQAHAQGFCTMPMLERWVDMAVAVGFGFAETEAWAVRTLKRVDMSPRAKLKRLESASVFAVRAKKR